VPVSVLPRKHEPLSLDFAELGTSTSPTATILELRSLADSTEKPTDLPITPPEAPLVPRGEDDLRAEEARWRAQGRPLIGQVVAKPRPTTTTAAPVHNPPDRWTVVHVLDRLEEAFETLSRLPMNTRPRGYSNSMPVYAYDRSDLIAQVETGELERMMRLQNRVRFSPTSAEISRTEESLCWCLEHLGDSPEIARAVQLGALWAAMRQDANRRLKAMKINRRAFNRRKIHGLQLIAIALIRNGVRVS
jgi:hypothetical protein